MTLSWNARGKFVEWRQLSLTRLIQNLRILPEHVLAADEIAAVISTITLLTMGGGGRRRGSDRRIECGAVAHNR